MNSELYFSVDIETNGLMPGFNSMISLGAVAFDLQTGQEYGTFLQNLVPDPDTVEDPGTMEWWKGFPLKYIEATTNPLPPAEVLLNYATWWQGLAGDKTAVFSYWKPAFDGAFIRYYRYKFLKQQTNRFSDGVDIKTLAATALGWAYSDTKIETVPESYKGGLFHSHNALEDAIEQKNVLVSAYSIIRTAINAPAIISKGPQPTDLLTQAQ